MEALTPYIFRFIGYTLLGLTIEVVFATKAIELTLGTKIKRRVPIKYMEGFVSLYMIPAHGFGMLFLFENIYPYIADFHIILRYLFYCVVITLVEALYGLLMDKTLGFYTWDYYADSKYKIFNRGYTLWTLVPFWGIAGLIIEVISGLLIHLSPHVVNFFF